MIVVRCGLMRIVVGLEKMSTIGCSHWRNFRGSVHHACLLSCHMMTTDSVMIHGTLDHPSRWSLLTSTSVVYSRRWMRLDTVLSEKSPPAIIAFTETWLDDTIVNGDIAVQGYNVYRKNRNRHGGGIAVYVADRLKVTRRSDLEMDDIELIWLELQERATRRALFGAAYRPPRSQ